MEIENIAKSNVLKQMMEMADEEIKKRVKNKKPVAVSIELHIGKNNHEERMKKLRESLKENKE